MKNLEVLPFRTHEDAVKFLSSHKDCHTTGQLCDKLLKDGYCQFKRWHIVIDPTGEVEATKPHPGKQRFNLLSNFFKAWRAKK